MREKGGGYVCVSPAKLLNTKNRISGSQCMQTLVWNNRKYLTPHQNKGKKGGREGGMIMTKYKEDEAVDYRRKNRSLPLVLSF